MKQVYEAIGVGYARARRPDPRIEALISQALGDAVTVVNVGAGTGNYEPTGGRVMAVEPALEMLSQRPANKHPSVRAIAEALPFQDQAFEVRAPGVEEVRDHLEVRSVTPVPIPWDCIDGFAGAYWGRPEAYLDPSVRAGISSLAQLSPELVERCASRLEGDLAFGSWDARYGNLRSLPEFDLGYRLVVAG